jgi:hypothetical protein
MNAEEFRTAVLKVPGAIESEHMNHPDFRVKGKIFASLGYPDDGWGMIKLTPVQQRAFMKEAPEMFSPCAGAWGKAGSTSVLLASAKKRILSNALRAASQNTINPTQTRSGAQIPRAESPSDDSPRQSPGLKSDPFQAL